MKKVLVLACSPEKGGNSDTLANEFIKGMSSVEWVQIQKIYLHDVPFAPYSYMSKFPDPNAEPEFAALTQQLDESDGLVIATPTYNFGVPAPLKNFIDRIGFMALDYKKLTWAKQPTWLLGNLRTFCIVTWGTPDLMQKMLFFAFPRFLLWVQFFYYGVRRSGSAFAGGLSFSNPAKKRPTLLKKYEKLGRTYAQKVIKDVQK